MTSKNDDESDGDSITLYFLSITRRPLRDGVCWQTYHVVNATHNEAIAAAERFIEQCLDSEEQYLFGLEDVRFKGPLNAVACEIAVYLMPQRSTQFLDDAGAEETDCPHWASVGPSRGNVTVRVSPEERYQADEERLSQLYSARVQHNLATGEIPF